MNDVISRLKDATTAAGDTISEVPPLRLEQARKGFLVPVAAALAVGLAIAGSVVMTRGGLNQTAAGTAAPRFIVEAREQSEVIVRGVTDGAELDRVGAMTGWLYRSVQAAPDNRTFYALLNGPAFCSSRIVRFTVDDAGRAGELADVPVRPAARSRISAFAVSGDGTKVVFGTVPCVRRDDEGRGFLVVADAQSGEGRRFQVKAGSGFTSISTSDDGSQIAYTTMPAGRTMTVSEPAVVVGSPSAPPRVAPSGAPTPASSVAPPPTPVSGAAPAPTPAPSAASALSPAPSVAPPPTPTPVPAPSGVPTAFISVPPSGVAAPSGGAPEDVVIVPMPTPMASGNVVIVVPSPGPSPSGGIVVYSAPTAVPPTLGTLEGVSSCRFFALREDVQIPVNQLRVVDCADSPEVYVLDADEPGDPPRRVVLSGELDGTRVHFYGVRMSPDGTRLIAGVSTGMTRLDDPQAAIMTFDPAGEEPAEVLYRGRAWLRVLDLAAGGSRVLVQSEQEIGEVSGDTYRKVMDIPGRVMDGVVAW
ncbi:hypothetical protein GT755_17825 [Herbidospora sp. NEAU-GS84]|uniref:Uncharacterized protein n=1 Tax=Herbidospora solisilvae TaxID=2696284 RepID=A0A7C9J3E1_9ACTN|nr:hypothetical protein [Herbidospora solisilvae]NAS23546.1 hypothetical protein [Herbidospora solisilvae]